MLAPGFMLPVEHRSFEVHALDGRQEFSPWIRRRVRLLIDRCCLRRLVCYVIRCGQRSRVSCSSFIRYAHSLREGGCKVFSRFDALRIRILPLHPLRNLNYSVVLALTNRFLYWHSSKTLRLSICMSESSQSGDVLLVPWESHHRM